jgi:hypothetical protein
MKKFLNLVLSLILATLSIAACAAWLNTWCPAVADLESDLLRVIIPAISIVLTIMVFVGCFAGENMKEKMIGLVMQIAGTAYFGGLLWVIFVWNTGSFADTQPHKMLACFGLVCGIVFFIPVMAGILGIDIKEK